MVKRKYGGKRERKCWPVALYQSGNLAESEGWGSCHPCSTITAEVGEFMGVNGYVDDCFVIMESAFPSTQLQHSAGIGRLGIYPQSYNPTLIAKPLPKKYSCVAWLLSVEAMDSQPHFPPILTSHPPSFFFFFFFFFSRASGWRVIVSPQSTSSSPR